MARNDEIANSGLFRCRQRGTDLDCARYRISLQRLSHIDLDVRRRRPALTLVLLVTVLLFATLHPIAISLAICSSIRVLLAWVLRCAGYRIHWPERAATFIGPRLARVPESAAGADSNRAVHGKPNSLPIAVLICSSDSG